MIDLCAAQPFEEDDLVDPVDEFRTEMSANRTHHDVSLGLADLAGISAGERIGAEVRRHDDDRVAEIDSPAMPVCQTPIVKHL